MKEFVKDESHLICIDMGGTSLDGTLINEGRYEMTTEGEVGGYRVALPVIDIHTIGAGGCFLAQILGVDHWNLFKMLNFTTGWALSADQYMEIGRRLLEGNSRFKELNGISAKAYLEKARTMLQEMNLQWDLDELDKISPYS